MASLYNPQPLTELDRHATAVTLVLAKKLGLPAKVTEVDWCMRTKQIVPHPNSVGTIIQVECSNEVVVFMCPWCKKHQVKGQDGPQTRSGGRHRFEKNGLFWHGHCNRPCYLYSPAECGQPDYDDGW